jgi:hypothetical protein
MRVVLAALVALGSLPFPIFAQQYADPTTAPAQLNEGFHPQKARVSSVNLPITFEENSGQADGDAAYVAHVGGAMLGFSAGRVALHLPREGNQLSLSFVGTRKSALSVKDRTGGESNYLIGTSPADWHTHIPQYGQLKYSNLYPGVDLIFYGNGKELEHDFVVAPGGDYRSIRMHYEGMKSLAVSAQGALELTMREGIVEIKPPKIYQMNGSVREEREGRFVLTGKNEVGFHIEKFDSVRPLVIDPVLNYSTYLASSALNVDAVAVDGSGNTYVLGDTAAPYPTTSGAFQQTCNSCVSQTDLFITKLNATGTAQIYSTYLGGNARDRGIKIVVDANGNAIVGGTTESFDFPLKNPVVTSGVPGNGGIDDAFITSLAPDGASLNFSTRLGSTASPVTWG